MQSVGSEITVRFAVFMSFLVGGLTGFGKLLLPDIESLVTLKGHVLAM